MRCDGIYVLYGTFKLSLTQSGTYIYIYIYIFFFQNTTEHRCKIEEKEDKPCFQFE